MPPSREPWIKLKIGTRRSDKLAALPDHGARWGYVCLLLEAKTQRRMGVFVGRGHVGQVLGELAAYLDDWITQGLVHVAPDLCDECDRRHAPDRLKAGELVVHDFLLEQRDPTNAERQELYRKTHAPAPPNADVTPGRVSDQPGATESVTTPSVTTPPAPISPNADVTADSRAGGTTATETRRREKKNVLDEEVDGAKAVPTRDDGPLLSHRLVGRPGSNASAGSRAAPALTVSSPMAALKPAWRTPCTNYTAHQLKHRLIDGQAVCEPCEAALAAAAIKPNGADVVESAELGL